MNMRHILWLIILWSFTAIGWADQGCYSIQVKAVLLAEQEAGLALYHQLKDKKYLVYYYQLPLNDEDWFRLRLGCFKTREQAKQFGNTFEQKEKLSFFVTHSELLMDTYQDKFEVITTPSAIWFHSAQQDKVLYAFSGINELAFVEQSQARIAPDGKHIVFYANEQIIEVDLESGAHSVLATDVVNAQPQWSADGQYIGYLDDAEWETTTSLCVLKAKKHNCLIKNDAKTQKAVKSFLWHPNKNIIFFVEGHAYGTVTVGGNLYAVDMKAKRQEVVKAPTENQEVGTDFEIKDGFIHYKLYQFDEQYIHKKATVKKIKLP